MTRRPMYPLSASHADRLLRLINLFRSIVKDIATMHLAIGIDVSYSSTEFSLDDFRRRVEVLEALQEALELAIVDELKIASRWVTWDQIGGVLHVTKQAAWTRGRKKRPKTFAEILKNLNRRPVLPDQFEDRYWFHREDDLSLIDRLRQEARERAGYTSPLEDLTDDDYDY